MENSVFPGGCFNCLQTAGHKSGNRLIDPTENRTRDHDRNSTLYTVCYANILEHYYQTQVLTAWV